MALGGTHAHHNEVSFDVAEKLEPPSRSSDYRDQVIGCDIVSKVNPTLLGVNPHEELINRGEPVVVDLNSRIIPISRVPQHLRAGAGNIPEVFFSVGNTVITVKKLSPIGNRIQGCFLYAEDPRPDRAGATAEVHIPPFPFETGDQRRVQPGNWAYTHLHKPVELLVHAVDHDLEGGNGVITIGLVFLDYYERHVCIGIVR